MTTLVALATKDALVMGCDSLGSVTVPLIEPIKLSKYFNADDELSLKVDEDGKPILKNFNQITEMTELIPYNHMTHVSKLFSLWPLPMGVMATGIVSIGERTIKSLIGEFKTNDPAFSFPKKPTNYTVNSIGRRLLEFVWSHYSKEYKKQQYKPELELIIGGYDLQSQVPAVYRILVHDNKIETTIKQFGVVFGGQMKEIQRIAFGSDFENKVKMRLRSDYLLNRYYELLSKYLKEQKHDIILPKPSGYSNDLRFIDDKWDLDGFDANWGDFSEQNAIDCVDFFVDVMIKSQQFSDRLPTVGGEVHIAVICKFQGFRFVSAEEWRHGDHAISITED
jgi:hypothetical protein